MTITDAQASNLAANLVLLGFIVFVIGATIGYLLGRLHEKQDRKE